MMRVMTLVLTVLVVRASVTATAEVVETKDGRTILLKEDGTYEVIGRKGERSNREYSRISVVDITLDRDKLHGKGVETKGTMTAGTTGSELVSLMLYDQPSRVGVWVMLAMDRLTREQKRRILVGCMSGCEAVVRGEVKKGTLVTEIILDDFEITGRR